MSGGTQRWFCYMVQCRDGSLYVGIAVDPVERTKKHNWGVGAAFTAKRKPVELVWFEELSDRRAAHKREIELKGWTKQRKLKLIAAFQAQQGCN